MNRPLPFLPLLRWMLAWLLVLAPLCGTPAPRPLPHPAPGVFPSQGGAAPAPAAVAVPAPPSGSVAEPLPERVRRHLAEMGPWAPAAFVVLFVVTCVAGLPTVPLTVAAGALWGAAGGILLVWIGVILGSSTAFLVGRHLARDWVSRRLARHPRLRAIEEAVSAEGWRIVVLARLAPGSPFFLLNYLFGLTRIGFWEHLGATAISVLPGSFLFVYLGSIGEMALQGRIRTVWDWILLGIGLVALAGGIRLIAGRSRRLLDARLRRSPEASTAELAGSPPRDRSGGTP